MNAYQDEHSSMAFEYHVNYQGDPLFNFSFQSFAPHIFLMEFNALISNIVQACQNSEKIDVAGRLKLNLDSYRRIVRM